jgi:hypothetical protein
MTIATKVKMGVTDQVVVILNQLCHQLFRRRLMELEFVGKKAVKHLNK